MDKAVSAHAYLVVGTAKDPTFYEWSFYDAKFSKAWQQGQTTPRYCTPRKVRRGAYRAHG